jgi:hypothetical protein
LVEIVPEIKTAALQVNPNSSDWPTSSLFKMFSTILAIVGGVGALWRAAASQGNYADLHNLQAIRAASSDSGPSNPHEGNITVVLDKSFEPPFGINTSLSDMLRSSPYALPELSMDVHQAVLGHYTASLSSATAAFPGLPGGIINPTPSDFNVLPNQNIAQDVKMEEAQQRNATFDTSVYARQSRENNVLASSPVDSKSVSSVNTNDLHDIALKNQLLDGPPEKSRVAGEREKFQDLAPARMWGSDADIRSHYEGFKSKNKLEQDRLNSLVVRKWLAGELLKEAHMKLIENENFSPYFAALEDAIHEQLLQVHQRRTRGTGAKRQRESSVKKKPQTKQKKAKHDPYW